MLAQSADLGTQGLYCSCVAITNHGTEHQENREAEKLAAELAALTGETKTQAVTRALKERLERVARRGRRAEIVLDRLHDARHPAALPVLR